MYRKIEKDGYILGVAKVPGQGNISESEYNALVEILRNPPESADGYYYLLNTDLEWTAHEVSDDSEPAEDMTETEQKALAYDILTGVSE